jgi:hypothetical protein
MERKVKFRLEKEYNKRLGDWDVVVHREGLGTQRFAMAKKEICLVAVLANTFSCQFDNAILADGESVEFELKMKINRK